MEGKLIFVTLERNWWNLGTTLFVSQSQSCRWAGHSSPGAQHTSSWPMSTFLHQGNCSIESTGNQVWIGTRSRKAEWCFFIKSYHKQQQNFGIVIMCILLFKVALYSVSSSFYLKFQEGGKSWSLKLIPNAFHLENSMYILHNYVLVCIK